jgi:hypothetical protein
MSHTKPQVIEETSSPMQWAVVFGRTAAGEEKRLSPIRSAIERSYEARRRIVEAIEHGASLKYAVYVIRPADAPSWAHEGLSDEVREQLEHRPRPVAQDWTLVRVDGKGKEGPFESLAAALKFLGQTGKGARFFRPGVYRATDRRPGKVGSWLVVTADGAERQGINIR